MLVSIHDCSNFLWGKNDEIIMFDEQKRCIYINYIYFADYEFIPYFGDKISNASLSPNGKYLAFSDVAYSSMIIIDVESSKIIYNFYSQDNDVKLNIVWSKKDNMRLYFADGDNIYSYTNYVRDSTYKTTDINMKVPLQKLISFSMCGSDDVVKSIDTFKNNHLLISTKSEREKRSSIDIYNLRFMPIYTLDIKRFNLCDCKASPIDGKFIYCTNSKNMVKLYLMDGEDIDKYDDENYIDIDIEKHSIWTYTWNFNWEKHNKKTRFNDEYVNIKLYWSHNGKYFAAMCNLTKKLRIWNLKTKKMIEHKCKTICCNTKINDLWTFNDNKLMLPGEPSDDKKNAMVDIIDFKNFE